MNPSLVVLLTLGLAAAFALVPAAEAAPPQPQCAVGFIPCEPIACSALPTPWGYTCVYGPCSPRDCRLLP